MVGITMTMSGTQAVKDVFGNKAPAAVMKAIKQELQKTGNEGVSAMKEDAPVDTGELEDSIGVDITGEELTFYASAEHAAHQEYGTIHMSAQPYFEANAKHAQDNFVKRLDAQIKQYLPH